MMRRILQGLASVAAVWAFALLVTPPHIDYGDFEVECSAILSAGGGSDDLDTGIEPGWALPDGSADIEDATPAPDDDDPLAASDADERIDPYLVGDACNARRTRWTGWAVVASLLVAGLLRLAVAAPAPPAPVPTPRDRRRASPLTPED
jgi:hypothetical protein